MSSERPESPVSGSMDGAGSDSLEGRFATLQRWNAAGRFVAVGTVVVLAGMFGAFGWKTYGDVRSNFTPDRTRAAVEAALPQVVPPVGEALKGVMTEALPAYRQLAAERFPAVRERLAEASLARLEALPDQAGEVLSDALTRTFRQTVRRVEPEFTAVFPSLADEQLRDTLMVYVYDAIEAKNVELARKIEGVGVSEAARIRHLLEQLRLPPDDAGPGDAELQKRLVRTLVRLVEAELDAFDATPPGASSPRGPMSATLEGN